MQIDWWTLGLQTVNVLILIWILARFLFRPVAAIIAARQEETVRLSDEVKAAKAESAAEQVKAAAENARLAGERGDILKVAAQEAEAERATILATARTEANQMRAAAEAEIKRAQDSVAASFANRASQLAVDIAAKLLARLPVEMPVAGFVDGLAAAVAGLPDETRRSFGLNGTPVRLRAIRALSTAEAERCRTALSKALGQPVELAVEIDPSLIAGLEIETPHAVVRNSLRADLDRIATELTHHDHAGS